MTTYFENEIKRDHSGRCISSTNRENSTGNDLTITGKYNSGGKVYKNVIAREQD